MTLAPGTRIGNCEVEGPLGAGGMGVVYRARDTRLERAVAIKALPAAFAADPGRLARFEREAKLLAALHHPNVASIFGLEDVAGTPYLVLELVEGESLAARLARGPLGVGETLDVVAKIAAGIEAAHERGIVHRDLKPGNVMLARGGGVKVLDFGLAKSGATPAPADLSVSPTVAIAPSTAGLVLGTAPYMSPEQARGREVDRRTDVWAFGCIVYECLAGRAAFGGETVSDVVARILEREPDMAPLAAAPERLATLVRRCLTKDPEQRPRDIGDLRRELVAIAAETSGERPATGGDARPSLAVLYFDSLSSSGDDDYFCAGVTEDIITDLSKIRGLRVASRNAVVRWRGQRPDPAAVGRELGVRAVLEGSVRRAGDRVRISAQLVNAADGFHLWAERWDRTLADVFAVQEEIASAIAQALRVTLTASESANLVQHRPDDARAYDLYLKGRAAYGRYSIESMEEALARFREALELDPDYALALAGVADAYGQLLQIHPSSPRIEEWTRAGLEAARRATQLQPGLPEGWKAEALVLRGAGREEESIAALGRALQANPRFTPALTNLAVRHVDSGDIAGAERCLRRVLEIDPQEQFSRSWLASLCLFTGREGEVRALTDEMLAAAAGAQPYTSWGHSLRIMASCQAGAFVEANRLLESAGPDAMPPDTAHAMRAHVARSAGRSDEAAAAFARIRGTGDHNVVAALSIISTALVLGDRDRALATARERIQGGIGTVILRLVPEAHGLLDGPPLGPRRCDVALVWPLEAPMIDARVHALFREVRIESGRPGASESFDVSRLPSGTSRMPSSAG